MRKTVAVALLAAVVLAGAAGWWWQRHRESSTVVALRQIAAIEGTWDNPWDLQDRKIAELQKDLAAQTHPIKRLILKREIAQQYVNGGNAEPGIALLERTLDEYRPMLPPSDVETLKADIAFAYYRIGEQQNCATSKTSEVCLFPLQASGFHSARLGAMEAARRYEELLASDATNNDNALVYRWMLNICYMQLGKYPDGVPARWLIAASAFESERDLGAFRDIAAQRGIVEQGRAGGAILEDFDNDGHLDLMVSHMGLGDELQYFHNNGNGTFTRMTDQAGLRGQLGGLNIVQADYDNDGCIDVYVPRGAWYHDKGQFPASLLHNNCDGAFTDVTERAGVANNLPSQVAVWADFNGDGLLDLFVGNEIMRDHVAWPKETRNFRLYLNQGNGRFIDVGPESGIDVQGMVKGATVDDYDNDGRPDIYVSVMGGRNRLLHNITSPGGRPRFEDVTDKAGVAEPNMSFTTWFFDVDNDGWPDIFVTGYTAPMSSIVREMLGDRAGASGERPRLYRNNRDGTFTDVSRAMHLDRLLLTMGANFGDLDNDGWLDIYLGTGAAPLPFVVPNQMFRNAGGKVFENITTSGGFGHLQKGHAVAFGDIDNTGNQDVFENIGGAMTGDKFYSALYKNPGHPGNHWLKLDLVGGKANRMGVGARIRVSVSEVDGSRRDIYRTVNSGGSFGSSSLRPHIGVGGAGAIDALEIRWAGSGTVQTFKGPIAVDARYVARENSPRLERARDPALAARTAAAN